MRDSALSGLRYPQQDAAYKMIRKAMGLKPIPPAKPLPPATAHLREGQVYDPNKVRRWSSLGPGSKALRRVSTRLQRKGWSSYQKRERRRQNARAMKAAQAINAVMYPRFLAAMARSTSATSPT